jgi:hypothetical protein
MYANFAECQGRGEKSLKFSLILRPERKNPAFAGFLRVVAV